MNHLHKNHNGNHDQKDVTNAFGPKPYREPFRLTVATLATFIIAGWCVFIFAWSVVFLACGWIGGER
jgi:hypothetical protein